MFSIIIATRDRPELLARALRSVAAQRHDAYELVLVDDSASGEARARNAAEVAATVPGATIVAAGEGLGPGEARNRGIAAARGEFLAFLDDDDEWIDPDYLRRAGEAVAGLGLDLLFADQMAVRADGRVVEGPVWAEDLAEKVRAAGVTARDGAYLLTVEQVLLSDGFAHLNTTILRRSLVDELGGFDAAIRYEEDRDLYLRAIDAAGTSGDMPLAGTIGYMPLVVARHHVPEGRASASSISVEEREACRLAVLGKGVAGARHPAVRARCRRDRASTLKKASVRAAAAGRFDVAVRQGRAALRDRFSWKWAAFVAGLYVRSAVSRRAQAE